MKKSSLLDDSALAGDAGAACLPSETGQPAQLNHWPRNSKQLDRFLESTRLAIVVFAADMRCICASQAALELFGASRLQDISSPASAECSPPLQPDDQPSWQKWQQLVMQAREQGSLVFEWEFLRTDGTPLSARVNLTHSADDDIIHCSIDDITDLKLAQSRLEFLAYHDPVTSLPNRHLALEHLNQQLDRQDSPAGVGVISLEFVNFSGFNDAYGHSMGDRLLKQVAAYLSCSLPPGFRLYRMNGAEYLLLASDLDSHAGLASACQLLAYLSGHRIQIEDVDFHLDFRIGASLGPDDSLDAAKLLRQASLARDHARRDDARLFRLYEPQMNDELLRFIQTGHALRSALEQQQFELHYQPQVDLVTGAVVGAEALIRWHRPGIGLVSPGEFIGAAEETGLIRPIGRWALREACRQAVQWIDAGWPGLKIAVNLSAVQFRHESVKWDVLDALAESGLPAGLLELELTESLLLADGNQVASSLSSWKAAGIQLAIDDFGTGYSSLSYLKRLAVDKLKIDRSFIHDFLTDSQDRSIVKAILQMARSLRLSTVAEGIESIEVARHLRQLGCQVGQGFLYARPMPADEFLPWLRQYRPGAPAQ